MEIRLSQYQAVILNKAIGIFRTRKIRNSTLIDDAYVLQKRLAEWIVVNTSPTGNSTSLSATKADSLLAFNTVINDNTPAIIIPADDVKDVDDFNDDIIFDEDGLGMSRVGGGLDITAGGTTTGGTTTVGGGTTTTTESTSEAGRGTGFGN